MANDVKMESSFIVIKGRFKAMSSSSYGMFVVFMDNLSKSIEKHDVVASHFSTLYENNLGMPWNELEEIITKLKWKGEYATSLTHDIQASIEDLFQPGTGRTQDIWAHIKKGQLNKATLIFEEILSRPTTDKGVKVEIQIENITRAEIEDVKRSRLEREGKEVLSSAAGKETQAQQMTASSNAGLDDSAVMLEVSLVLSPISGIPIYDLKEGDKILVKITEQSNRGQYFIDLLNATVDNEVVPIPASVVRVTKEGKIYTVLVGIGPGIYGKSLDEDTMKVKKYDPAQDKRKKSEAPAAAAESTIGQSLMGSRDPNKKKNNNLLYVIIAAAAILMFIIIIYLFM